MNGTTGPLGNRSRHAAFFCYHSVAADGPEYLSIAPEQFERQLGQLQRSGWTTGAEAELERLGGGERPDRPVAFLTFDDGYVDNHDVVLPLLQQYGARAIVFVIPPLVDDGLPLRWPGTEAHCDRFPQVMRSMRWRAVEALAEAGCTIGSHTLTHPRLAGVGDEQLRDELLEARQRISARLGSCTTLAYPYGNWDGRVLAAARDAGYRWAFTVPRDGQLATDPLAIPRIAVDHRDDERRFALKLRPLARRAALSPRRATLLRP